MENTFENYVVSIALFTSLDQQLRSSSAKTIRPERERKKLRSGD